MKNYLKNLNVQFKKFKQHKTNNSLSVNLEGTILEGINLLYASLFCSNNNLKGSFTTLQKSKRETAVPQIISTPYIEYAKKTFVYVFKDDIISNETDKIKQQLENYQLCGFSSKIQKLDMVELPIEHIAYTKKEIVANEYIQLPPIIVEATGHYQQNKFNNTEDILTDYYLSMYTNGNANPIYLQKIKLDDILTLSDQAHQTAINEINRKKQNKLNI